MNAKELLLSMKSYEDFDNNRDAFKDLKIDKEGIEHLNKIFPEAYAPTDMHREVYPLSGNFDDWD